ncbi:16S rRNA (cytosine(1402)-N(4))-methyltransferase RsmH [Rurimicrobium arvi]|uniref:Ribosomal RNA small subunit methyltransferase H n=1 Tax=Rurimicrobium arvi TaxID=2049916 RepID=A0ABP8MHT6_9BACT
MAQQDFYHATVMLEEAVEGLAVKPDGVYVDCTMGGAGHTRRILQELGPQGRIIAFDQDKDAWANKPDDGRVILVQENFRYLKRFLRLHGITAVDGILADLGVSSYQFDTGARGFSIRFDGPLDMRMDDRLELTAKDIIDTYSEERLHKLFERYGEVRNAKQLAKQIVTGRGKASVYTTDDLKSLIDPVIKGPQHRYLAQVFQALRIEVNDELGALRELLEQSAQCLKPEGRLSIISFHSLEDRLVKQFMKNGAWDVTEDPLGLAPRQRSPFRELTKKPVEPTEQEQKNNTRARSAKLRVAEKI